MRGRPEHRGNRSTQPPMPIFKVDSPPVLCLHASITIKFTSICAEAGLTPNSKLFALSWGEPRTSMVLACSSWSFVHVIKMNKCLFPCA
eukprot:576171-Amphidinium_carterae.1